MKHILKPYRILLLVVSLFVISFSISAQSLVKFGHIDTQALLMSMPEWSIAISKLEDLKTDQNEKLKKLQDDFQQKMQLYSEKKALLNPEAVNASEQELETMRETINTLFEDGNALLQQKEQELTEPVIKKALQAIKTVGTKEGFLYIFDSTKGTTVFNSEQSIDILSMVKVLLGIK